MQGEYRELSCSMIAVLMKRRIPLSTNYIHAVEEISEGILDHLHAFKVDVLLYKPFSQTRRWEKGCLDT